MMHGLTGRRETGAGLPGLSARGALCLAALALAATPAVADAARAATPRLHAAPAAVPVGGRTVISGAGAAGALVELQASVRGGRYRDVAHTTVRPGGRFRFPPLRVSGDTAYRVRGLRSAPVLVTVLLPPYPSGQRVAAAVRYLAGRGGASGFAVVDSRGRLHGWNLHERFHSASVVKAMMLVAYLRMLEAHRAPLDAGSRALLYPMIHESNNDDASAVLGIEGQPALDRVARDAGMQDFEPAHGWWAWTEVSAADLARFFYRMDAMIPPRFDGYARYLLSTIEPSQSWGAPPVARPEFQVYFKTGWLPESEGLINEAARLERPDITFAMAVLTRGNPSQAYGEETIAGVTARLLGRAA
jgi:hypothetical protein